MSACHLQSIRHDQIGVGITGDEQKREVIPVEGIVEVVTTLSFMLFRHPRRAHEGNVIIQKCVWWSES